MPYSGKKLPSRGRIEEHWRNKPIPGSDRVIDVSRCFVCVEDRPRERCHVVPQSIGGTAALWNLVLLCASCHSNNPNVSDPRFYWHWMVNYDPGVSWSGLVERYAVALDMTDDRTRAVMKCLELIGNMDLVKKLYAEASRDLKPVPHFGSMSYSVGTTMAIFMRSAEIAVLWHAVNEDDIDWAIATTLPRWKNEEPDWTPGNKRRFTGLPF